MAYLTKTEQLVNLYLALPARSWLSAIKLVTMILLFQVCVVIVIVQPMGVKWYSRVNLHYGVCVQFSGIFSLQTGVSLEESVHDTLEATGA